MWCAMHGESSVARVGIDFFFPLTGCVNTREIVKWGEEHKLPNEIQPR
jgi:hypothetical protein